MSSSKVSSSNHRDNWDASPESGRIRHGRRDLSPVPPPPAESLGETRRVFLKRKHDDPPSNNAFAARTMQEFLRTESTKDTNDSPIPTKRPKSSVVVVSKPSVDRVDLCPILVRVFYTTDGRHTPSSAFADGKYPSNEVQINTWMNASLKELSQDIVFAVKSQSGERKRQPQLKISQPIRLHYSSVFPDNVSRGKYRKRDLGFCVINNFADGDEDARVSLDDSSATLESKKFHIGDFLDVAICNVGERRIEDGSRARRGLDKKDAGRF
nr:histone deacetylase complex subunit sap18 [Hymenolepis microstoma]